MAVERFTEPPSSDRFWLDSGDPLIAERLRKMWAFTARLVPIRPPRGLRKYRSVEEADQAREAWEAERILRLAELRRSPPPDDQ